MWTISSAADAVSYGGPLISSPDATHSLAYFSILRWLLWAGLSAVVLGSVTNKILTQRENPGFGVSLNARAGPLSARLSQCPLRSESDRMCHKRSCPFRPVAWLM
jgi:hypothetical protein